MGNLKYESVYLALEIPTDIDDKILPPSPYHRRSASRPFVVFPSRFHTRPAAPRSRLQFSRRTDYAIYIARVNYLCGATTIASAIMRIARRIGAAATPWEILANLPRERIARICRERSSLSSLPTRK